MAIEDIKQFLEEELGPEPTVFEFLGVNVEDFDTETLLLLAKWQAREDERRC